MYVAVRPDVDENNRPDASIGDVDVIEDGTSTPVILHTEPEQLVDGVANTNEMSTEPESEGKVACKEDVINDVFQHYVMPRDHDQVNVTVTAQEKLYNYLPNAKTKNNDKTKKHKKNKH